MRLGPVDAHKMIQAKLNEEIPGQLALEEDPDYEVERFGPNGLLIQEDTDG